MNASAHASIIDRIFLWIPPLIVAGVILWASSRAAPANLPSWKHADKIMHFAIYLILGLSFSRALVKGVRPEHVAVRLFLAVILSAAYGVSDEIHQAFVPERTPEVADLIADWIGATAGSLVYWKWNKRNADKEKR